jgi:hypothetical protein
MSLENKKYKQTVLLSYSSIFDAAPAAATAAAATTTAATAANI